MNLGSMLGGLGKAIKNVNWGGAAKKVGRVVAQHPDAIIGGVGMLQGARQDAAATDLENQALQRAQQLFDQKAPLRKLSASLLQQAPTRDLSALTADDGNPFTRRGRP